MYFIDKAEQLKDKINQETNIVIWGYGNYGRMFHAELKKFTRNIYIYDKKFKEISIMFELMLNLVKKNGYVVIAVSAEKNIVEIYNELMKSGVNYVRE